MGGPRKFAWADHGDLRGRTANFRGPASSQLYISGGGGGGGVHREKKEVNPYDHS